MKKPFLFALIATFSTLTVSAAAANEKAEPMSSSSSMVTVQFSLTGCSVIPPNGYFTIRKSREGFHPDCGKDAGGIRHPYYLYESYFDKPIGYRMSLCFRPQAPLPSGWFEVPVASSCGIGTPTWTIQRFS